MALVAVLYDYTDDLDTRLEARPRHREFLDALPNLLAAGAHEASGAILIFEGEPAEVEKQLDADPYAEAGVIASRTVTGWTLALGRWKQQLGG